MLEGQLCLRFFVTFVRFGLLENLEDTVFDALGELKSNSCLHKRKELGKGSKEPIGMKKKKIGKILLFFFFLLLLYPIQSMHLSFFFIRRKKPGRSRC